MGARRGSGGSGGCSAAGAEGARWGWVMADALSIPQGEALRATGAAAAGRQSCLRGEQAASAGCPWVKIAAKQIPFALFLRRASSLRRPAALQPCAKEGPFPAELPSRWQQSWQERAREEQRGSCSALCKARFSWGKHLKSCTGGCVTSRTVWTTMFLGAYYYCEAQLQSRCLFGCLLCHP